VVAFYGFSSSDAALYLVMEYVPISFEAFVLGKVSQPLSTCRRSSVGPCQSRQSEVSEAVRQRRDSVPQERRAGKGMEGGIV
jgi:hypothetical protein